MAPGKHAPGDQRQADEQQRVDREHRHLDAEPQHTPGDHQCDSQPDQWLHELCSSHNCREETFHSWLGSEVRSVTELTYGGDRTWVMLRSLQIVTSLPTMLKATVRAWVVGSLALGLLEPAVAAVAPSRSLSVDDIVAVRE